jgi:hypothetical protein
MGGFKMHQQVIDFCIKTKNKHPNYFEQKTVLDIGSYDVNGNNRNLFTNCNYRGVDTCEGDNVDIISIAHELSFPSEYFDPFFYRSLPKMFQLLKPQGLLIITCAGPARHIHGTQWCNEPASNLSAIKGLSFFKNYYRNLLLEDFEFILNPQANFSSYSLTLQNNNTDLYFSGIKK